MSPMEKNIKIILLILLAFAIGFIIIKSDFRMVEKPAVEGPVTLETDKYTDLRQKMVDEQLKTRDITDEKVLEAMCKVPRHRFMPMYRNQAYRDHAVPIGYGQTISQPYIVALMTQELEIEETDRVLEIGTGSGYQAAVLAEIAEEVYTIEIIEELAERAEQTLKETGYPEVLVLHADGYFGWGDNAPFDAIMITAAANHIPPPLLEQLKDGGCLIMPLASPAGFETLTLITKQGDDLLTRHITGVRFVPMTGEAQK